MRDLKTAAKRIAPRILLGTAVALGMAAGTAYAGSSGTSPARSGARCR